MNETERDALEKELIWALMPYTDTEFQAGLAVMTIIDRLLAERDIDAMLNAVHPKAKLTGVYEIDGQYESLRKHGESVDPTTDLYYADIHWPYTEDIDYDCQTYNSKWGYGPTRVAAIADACRKAREATND